MTTTTPPRAGRRAVVIAGVRTPFVKAFTEFVELDTIALGVAATKALLKRSGILWRELDAMVWGGVILPSAAHNVGREIALDLRIPELEGMTVSRACATGARMVTTVANELAAGTHQTALLGICAAGGLGAAAILERV